MSKKETFLPEFSNYIANSSSVAWEKREKRVYIGRKLRGNNETMRGRRGDEARIETEMNPLGVGPPPLLGTQ